MQNLTAKILCLLVALALWAEVAGTMFVEEEVLLPLQVVGLPDSLTVKQSQIPEFVSVQIQGSKLRLLLDRVLNKEKGSVVVKLVQVSEGFHHQEISVRDVRSGATVVRIIDGSSLELQIFKKIHRNLPVRVAMEGQLPEGYTLAGEAELTPMQVRVTGPAPIIERLDHINTLPVSIDKKKDSFTKRVLLEKPAEDLVLFPIEVELVLGVDAIVIRNFANIPLMLMSEIAAERIDVESTMAQVEVRGPASKVNALLPADISVLLHIGDLESGMHELSAEVVLPDGIVSSTVNPASFQVVIHEKGSAP